MGSNISFDRKYNISGTMAHSGRNKIAEDVLTDHSMQVLYGRLSDIFGRKAVYLTALGLLCVSDFMCGASKTAPMLYFFRGLTGVAGGGITSLSMIIVSDIVTLEQRGKY